MKIKALTTALSAAALIATAVPAMALNTSRETHRGHGKHGQNGEWQRNNRGDQQERFRGMDRDGNGVITPDEWRGNENSFRKHDRDRNGVLSADELRGNGKARGRHEREDRDRDRDRDRE